MCMGAAALCGVTFVLLSESSIHPAAAMVVLSLSTSAVPVLLKSAVPIVAPRQAVGTAFALYAVVEAAAQGVGHIVLASLRDGSGSYASDLDLLAGMSFCALVAAAVLSFVDTALWQGILNAPSSPSSPTPAGR